MSRFVDVCKGYMKNTSINSESAAFLSDRFFRK